MSSPHRRSRFRIVVAVSCFAIWIAAPPLSGTVDGLEAQSASAPSGLAAATAKLLSGDAKGAATMLEALTAAEPGNAEAWRLLGIARRQTGQLDPALAAFGKALELQPGSGRVMFGIADVWALKGKADEAFRWLERAKATHTVDMTQAEVDPSLKDLKKDPRFAKLLPVPADFAHPFVESVKVVREWDGEGTNDQFGWIARNIGDVDDDGINDVVTSAPGVKTDGANAGRVYVYSTKSGRLLWKADGHAGDRLGTGLEAAGDTDGDGVPDVIAGAPGADKAYVYSGRDGRVLLTLAGEAKGDGFGNHAEGIGDVNHDGHADVMVGAPRSNAGGQAAGRAYVYSGKDGRVLLTLTGERAGDAFGSAVAGAVDGRRLFLIAGAPGAGPAHHGRVYVYDRLSSKPAFVIEPDATGNALGAMFLSVVGDVDADGIPDIYASDWSDGAHGPSTGRIYVQSGRDGHRLLTLTGETAGEGFGIGPADAGDVDGDGHADLVVGAWQYGKVVTGGGRVGLYAGSDGRLLKTYTGRIPGETFGFDATGLGDVDGDGTVDFLVTSAWSGIHGYHSGRMFVISSGVRRQGPSGR